MVSSWRVLLVTLAATTFSGASAQECSLEGQDSLCSSAVGLIDVCIGLDFFGSDCCDCETGLPGKCGIGRCKTAEPEPESTTPIEIACAGATSESAPEGVVSQVSIEQGWRLVSGEYDRHESGWRVNDEFTSEGAFASASFFGDYDLGATVSGSPTTVVEFGVAAYDAAGNYDACTFFLGILPEEDPSPAPAPVLPWWGYTPEPADPSSSLSEGEFWWNPGEFPAPSPSPVAPPVTTTAPITVDAPVPATTSPSPESTTADDTEEPTPSPVAVASPLPEAPVPTPAPVERGEPEAPAPTATQEEEESMEDDPSDTGFIEAGTKTTVTVSASAYDERPGESGDDVGCGEDGCLPDLAHDGIGEEDVESRWSCAKDIVSDGGQCEIEFTFGSPQHIMDVEVAFWKGEERARTLKVKINGDQIGHFESQSGSIVTSLGIEEDEVNTITLESIGIGKDEWISLLEVRFMVEP